MALMFGSSPLTRDLRELIGVVVSAANGCDYCVAHHAKALNHYCRDEERVKRVAREWRSADLPVRTQVMIEYVVKLSQNPRSIGKGHIQELRDVEFSDHEILNISLVASYFNFVNRIALGLGVESTDEEMRGYRY